MPHPTHRHAPVSVPRGHSAFTLIELLAVIAIAGVLAALVIGSVSKIRDAARRGTCSSNLRQIGAAFQLYAADNRGLWPAPRQPDNADLLTDPANPSKKIPPPWANPNGDNWQAEVNRYVFRDRNDGTSNLGDVKKNGAETNIAHCPEYDRLFANAAADIAKIAYKTAGYGMNFNINAGGSKIEAKKRFRASAVDHLATTILVGDSSDYHLGVDTVTWSTTTDAGKPDGYGCGAPHRHGSNANYLFADGHIAALSPDAALVALRLKP